MKSFKLVPAILAVAVAALAFTGCNNKPTLSGPTPKDKKTATSNATPTTSPASPNPKCPFVGSFTKKSAHGASGWLRNVSSSLRVLYPASYCVTELDASGDAAIKGQYLKDSIKGGVVLQPGEQAGFQLQGCECYSQYDGSEMEPFLRNPAYEGCIVADYGGEPEDLCPAKDSDAPVPDPKPDPKPDPCPECREVKANWTASHVTQGSNIAVTVRTKKPMDEVTGFMVFVYEDGQEKPQKDWKWGSDGATFRFELRSKRGYYMIHAGLKCGGDHNDSDHPDRGRCCHGDDRIRFEASDDPGVALTVETLVIE